MAGFALLVTLFKVGVPIAIGWWIDLSLDDTEEEKKVRRRLDSWWDRFDGISWFNFGQEEGKVALRLFDRVFGDRLWSWRRWISVLVVYLAGVALTVAWALGKLESIGARPPTPTTLELLRVAFVALINLPAALLSLALNLSLTRIASNRVVRLPGSYSVLGFAILFLGRELINRLRRRRAMMSVPEPKAAFGGVRNQN
jgi:hypothetical protein